ncbi:MAG TPA: tripartite tricarboxylate transporter substrate-binding protein [Xanthobacteraceae bacterium]|nr:tripartite tricarboxylate transporter substrate-binding protein [Xanthobacteraceae bacterium]
MIAGKVCRLLGFVALAGCYASAVQAQSPADFYKGKTITLVVSSGEGGGYDSWARTLSRHLPKHVPGNPQVIVKNMPGAGGIVAGNYLYKVAEKDGTVMGLLQNGVPFEPLFQNAQATFDSTKFNWIGTPSTETAVLTVWHTAPVNTWQDAKTTELTMGSTGAHSTPSFYGHLQNDLLGTKLKLIVGYTSQTTAFLAMERGELNGYPSVFYSSLKATKPDWIKNKQVKLLLQMGAEKDAALPDVPWIMDVLTKPEDRAVAQAAFGPLLAGRPFLMPPGVPADRVAAIRKAFDETLKDAEFLAEAGKARLEVSAPRTGEQLQQYIAQIYKDTSPAMVARLKQY